MLFLLEAGFNLLANGNNTPLLGFFTCLTCRSRPGFLNRGNLVLEVCFLVITDRGSMKEFNISCAFSSRGQFMLLSSPHTLPPLGALP